MQRNMRVFVSSTFEDLKEERNAAKEAIIKAGYFPIMMEHFPAGQDQFEYIKGQIDNADIYLLILGGRYGSINEETQKSYTQLEFEHAQKQSKKAFAIVMSDLSRKEKIDEGYDSSTLYEEEYRGSYKKFRREVTEKNLVYYNTNSKTEIQINILQQILVYEREYTASLEDELEKLKDQYDEDDYEVHINSYVQEILNGAFYKLNDAKDVDFVDDSFDFYNNYVGPIFRYTATYDTEEIKVGIEFSIMYYPENREVSFFVTLNKSLLRNYFDSDDRGNWLEKIETHSELLSGKYGAKIEKSNLKTTISISRPSRPINDNIEVYYDLLNYFALDQPDN